MVEVLGGVLRSVLFLQKDAIHVCYAQRVTIQLLSRLADRTLVFCRPRNTSAFYKKLACMCQNCHSFFLIGLCKKKLLLVKRKLLLGTLVP